MTFSLLLPRARTYVLPYSGSPNKVNLTILQEAQEVFRCALSTLESMVHSGRVGGGQTKLTTDRRILFFFLFICLAVERRSDTADSRLVDDGQTNSVLFHLSVWPSSAVPR